MHNVPLNASRVRIPMKIVNNVLGLIEKLEENVIVYKAFMTIMDS